MSIITVNPRARFENALSVNHSDKVAEGSHQTGVLRKIHGTLGRKPYYGRGHTRTGATAMALSTPFFFSPGFMYTDCIFYEETRVWEQSSFTKTNVSVLLPQGLKRAQSLDPTTKRQPQAECRERCVEDRRRTSITPVRKGG